MAERGRRRMRLRVNRATLYAYVSRGLVRSQSMPGASRERQYSRDDLERLRLRADERRDPGKAAARALHWGVPVLESAITLIDGTRLYYRGHDAVALSRSRSIAEVASLIWLGAFDAPFIAVSRQGKTTGRPGGTFVARAQSALADASSRDGLAFDLRPAAVAATGWRIISLLTAVAIHGGRADTTTIDRALAQAWQVGDRGMDLLRAALILCADHELNVSSFTARCVASAGSNPYAAVIAGLAALEGPKHGGASARVVSMLDSMRRSRRRTRRHRPDAPRRDARRLRASALPCRRPARPRSARSAARALSEVRGTQVRPRLRRCCSRGAARATERGLRARRRGARAAAPAGAPLTLFAIGRSIGWIGHAIEQYAAGQLIRPRAKYVGAVSPPFLRWAAAGPSSACSWRRQAESRSGGSRALRGTPHPLPAPAAAMSSAKSPAGSHIRCSASRRSGPVATG